MNSSSSSSRQTQRQQLQNAILEFDQLCQLQMDQLRLGSTANLSMEPNRVAALHRKPEDNHERTERNDDDQVDSLRKSIAEWSLELLASKF